MLQNAKIASIYRSDLSLIISEVEFKILNQELGIDASLLFYIPFVLHPTEIRNPKDFSGYETRKNFVFLGNFMHPPNVQAVQYFKTQNLACTKSKITRSSAPYLWRLCKATTFDA